MPYQSKIDQANAAARHYRLNSTAIKRRAAEARTVARQRNAKIVRNFLQTHSCVDCGENNPDVLEFDHVRGKKRGNVSDMSNRAVSVETLRREIAKCDIRCANCHRVATRKRRESAQHQHDELERDSFPLFDAS